MIFSLDWKILVFLWHICNKYRIPDFLKVKTDIITSMAVSPIGRAVIISVKTFKTNVIGFFFGIKRHTD
jgi:hypothetical protein